MHDPHEPAGASEARYVALVRMLGAATHAHCGDGDCSAVIHREDAATHINAFLRHPELIWKLRQIASGFKQIASEFEKLQDPINSATRALRSLGEALASQPDGSGEGKSSDG